VLDIVQKIWALLGKLFAPPGVTSWLRACVENEFDWPVVCHKHSVRVGIWVTYFCIVPYGFSGVFKSGIVFDLSEVEGLAQQFGRS